MLEGENITFLWTYTLDSTNVLALFYNVTGTTIIIATSTVDLTVLHDPNFEKRFTVEISYTEAKVTMLAVQMSDDRNKFKLAIATDTSASIADYVELIVQCK